MRGAYVISDTEGSADGLRVWFREFGIETDPEAMEILNVIYELQREINNIKATQFIESEFFGRFDPEDYTWEVYLDT